MLIGTPGFHFSHKSNNTPTFLSRWRPYHSRKVTSNVPTDNAHLYFEHEASLPTPKHTTPENHTHRRNWEQAVPIKGSTCQQPAPVTVQDPEGLIQDSLDLLASIYSPFTATRAAASQCHGASALPTPPSSPTPWANVPRIGPDLMRWFVVELLKRSYTSAPVIHAAIDYIDRAMPEIRRIIEESDYDANAAGSPLLDPRRVYLAAIILGSKFLLDRTYTNRTWASVSGLDALEVGRCERALAEALQWKLWSKDSDSTSH